MKKIVLAVLIACMALGLSVGLTACNSATPQGQLANILSDHNHEVFVYDALNTKDNSTGTYTVKLDAYKKGDSVDSFGTRKLENVNEGILISGELVFVTFTTDSNGNSISVTNTYKTGCYYTLVDGSKYMTPAFSYRTQSVNGKTTFSLQGEYRGNDYVYERTVGDNPKENGKVAVSGTVFDNNQFQQVLRSATTFSSSFSMSFNTPLVSDTESTAATLTASVSKTAKIKTAYTENSSDEDIRENGINCYQITLRRTTEVAGMAHTLTYTNSDVVIKGWKLKHVLLQIVEPYTENGERYEMQYSLNSATIA